MIESYICRCSDLTAIQFTDTFPATVLTNNQVHIWIAEVPVCIEYINQCITILSTDELGKAGSFHFKEDQDLYSLAHGLLRFVLSKYTSISPDKLRFLHNEKGKPYLAGIDHRCFFNLSHTSDRVIIAVNWLDEIGIDTEKLQADFVWQDIAGYYFNGYEIAHLATKENIEATKLFFTYWTRKEAFLKAIGAGLIDDLKSVEVSAAYNKFSLSNDAYTKSVRNEWNIVTFPVTDTHIGSVACSPDVQGICFYPAIELLRK